MMDRLVQAVEPAPGIRLLTLNRPDKLNALSKALLAELSQLLAGYDADTEVGIRTHDLTPRTRGKCGASRDQGGRFQEGASIEWAHDQRRREWADWRRTDI